MSLLTYVLTIFLNFSDGTELITRLDHEFRTETGCLASRTTAVYGLIDFEAGTVAGRPGDEVSMARVECTLKDPQ